MEGCRDSNTVAVQEATTIRKRNHLVQPASSTVEAPDTLRGEEVVWEVHLLTSLRSEQDLVELPSYCCCLNLLLGDGYLGDRLENTQSRSKSCLVSLLPKEVLGVIWSSERNKNC